VKRKKIILVAGAGAVVLVAGITLGVLVSTKDKTDTNITANQIGRHPDGYSKHENDHSAHTSSSQSDTQPMVDLTSDSEVVMGIKSFAYTKPNIKIKKGTKVTWINQDTVGHNVMKEHEHEEKVHDAPTADEVKPDVFASPLLARGESYSFIFNETGKIGYHCAPHPYMTGSITVVE
jgi:plastocyanin